ncbi:MAG: hypothetical protein CL569_13940 [Alphaproteobacteria bacterium]|nr:hypothetical protein [Alphaproteobacteria bacterium]|tara:strand:+ start:1445 stop:1945 length:501 start_codon:yes stop_codon:yes gene_type:complete
MWCFRSSVVALAALVSACGFEPLHAPSGGAVPTVLAGIDIAPIPNRLGQVVRNHLLDRLTPLGEPVFAEYRFIVSLRVAKEALAIARDDSATRFNVSLQADYDLVHVRSGNSVLQGEARSVAAYNVVSSDYANVVTERDAELRAARELSDEIKTRLSVYLSQNNRS